MADIKINVPESIGELAKEVYGDSLKPAAIETGKSLSTLTKFINTLLTPVALLNESVEIHVNMFLDSLKKNVKKIPADKVVQIETCILGPAMEDLKYSISSTELRELYVNVLSNAMNSDCANYPYRSFLKVIQQLSPLEALLFKENFRPEYDSKPVAQLGLTLNGEKNSNGVQIESQHLFNFAFKHLTPGELNICIDNFVRLGLLKIDMKNFLLPLSNYDYVQSTHLYKFKKQELIENSDRFGDIEIRRGYMSLTSFGESFYKICVLN